MKTAVAASCQAHSVIIDAYNKGLDERQVRVDPLPYLCSEYLRYVTNNQHDYVIDESVDPNSFDDVDGHVPHAAVDSDDISSSWTVYVHAHGFTVKCVQSDPTGHYVWTRFDLILA